MSKTRLPYPPEFRQKMVDLVRSGRSPEDLKNELEPSAINIRNWVAKANGAVETTVASPVPDERKEQLRKEVRILREEREILKKLQPGLRRGQERHRRGVRVHKSKSCEVRGSTALFAYRRESQRFLRMENT